MLFPCSQHFPSNRGNIWPVILYWWLLIQSYVDCHSYKLDQLIIIMCQWHPGWVISSLFGIGPAWYHSHLPDQRQHNLKTGCGSKLIVELFRFARTLGRRPTKRKADHQVLPQLLTRSNSSSAEVKLYSEMSCLIIIILFYWVWSYLYCLY